MRFFIALGAMALAVLSQASLAAQPTSRPNIVFILCDDLGYGDVRTFNPERGKISTPNIDQLATEGMMFTDAHASSAVCTPSRYSILTGRYCWRSRLQSGVFGGMASPLIAPERLTVASFLQKQGYVTACIGKWHLGLRYGPQRFTSPIADGPLQHGFNQFFGIAASLDMPPFAWIEDDRFSEAPMMTKRWQRSGPAAASFEAIDVMPTITKKAVEYVRANGTSDRPPYFLYLAYAAPHTPILPTPPWKGKSGLGDYADFVMHTDASVGEVLRAIDDSEECDNTIVYFASDNGFAPAAHPKTLESQGHFPSAGFRGYKADIWEGGHRIPLIVRWPEVVAPGSSSGQLVGLIDLFATTADILHRPLPQDTAEDSVSLFPILQGRDAPVRKSAVHHSIDGCFAIREGNWKLELCSGSGGWGSPRERQAAAQHLPNVQLYDIANDRREKHNLASDYPEIAQRLAQLLEQSITAGRTTPGPPLKNDVAIEIFEKSAVSAAATKVRTDKRDRSDVATAD